MLKWRNRSAANV